MLLLSAEPLGDVQPRRAGRVAFGSGLIAMMAVLITVSFAEHTPRPHALTILLIGWPMSIALAFAASAVARRRPY